MRKAKRGKSRSELLAREEQWKELRERNLRVFEDSAMRHETRMAELGTSQEPGDWKKKKAKSKRGKQQREGSSWSLSSSTGGLPSLAASPAKSAVSLPRVASLDKMVLPKRDDYLGQSSSSCTLSAAMEDEESSHRRGMSKALATTIGSFPRLKVGRQHSDEDMSPAASSGEHPGKLGAGDSGLKAKKKKKLEEAIVVRPSMGLSEGYSLVWRDDFDYEGPPHPSRWEFQTDANDWVHDARHGEEQWYTDRLENACVRNGRLRIIARRERVITDDNVARYSSARLRTKHRGDWVYGRVEVRARLPPCRRGLWPAIWMLPTDEIHGGWPHSGELDIMEHVGWEAEGTIHGAAHCADHNSIVGRQRTGVLSVPSAHRTFHTYTLEWSKDRILILVDNEPMLLVENKGKGDRDWPYDERFHLLLNLAVGGWGGECGIDDDAFPACLEVESVKIFQKNNNHDGG